MTGAKEENFSLLPTMRTSALTERHKSSARASRVRPSNSTNALSVRIRVLLPPARIEEVTSETGKFPIGESYTENFSNFILRLLSCSPAMVCAHVTHHKRALLSVFLDHPTRK